MPFFMYDSTFIFLIPAMLLAFYAQMKVSSTFNKFSQVRSSRGVTGADVARKLLSLSGITDVAVERVSGHLSDHYDPRAKRLRLSDSVYNSTSLAAIGVAAHETGHAVQHNVGYAALSLRNAIYPVVSISSNLSMPLIFIGLFLSGGRGQLGYMLMSVGIVLFLGVIIFQLITLPVEFNASKRALAMLEDYNFLSETETQSAKKVLSAAALTYVAAVIVSLANLLRFLALMNRRR